MEEKLLALKEWENHRDDWGLIQPWPGQTSGNGLRYTAEYEWARYFLGLQPTTKSHWAYAACVDAEGLVYRTPKRKFGQQSHDDLIGLFAWAALLHNKPPFVIRVRERLAKKFGFFRTDPDAPWQKTFLGRFQQLFAHADYALGKKPGLIPRLFWCVSVLYGAKEKQQDPKVLSWLMVSTYLKGGQAFLVEDIIVNYFIKKFIEHYPDGVGEVLNKYFGGGRNGKPLHPARIALDERFSE